MITNNKKKIERKTRLIRSTSSPMNLLLLEIEVLAHQ